MNKHQWIVLVSKIKISFLKFQFKLRHKSQLESQQGATNASKRAVDSPTHVSPDSHFISKSQLNLQVNINHIITLHIMCNVICLTAPTACAHKSSHERWAESSDLSRTIH